MQVKNTKDENKQTDRRTPDSIIIPYRIRGVIYLSRMWFGNPEGKMENRITNTHNAAIAK